MNRRGVALVAALSLITLLGLLIVGAIALTTLAQRSATASLADASLTAAAEWAVADALAHADALGFADLAAPNTIAFDVDGPSAPAIRTTVTATPLATDLLWLVATARLANDSAAHRRVNVIARFPTAGPIPTAAITAGGPVTLAPNVSVLADSACGTAPVTPFIVTSDSTITYRAAWQRSALEVAPNVFHVRRDTVVGGGAADTYEGMLVVDGDLVIHGRFVLTGLGVVHGSVRSDGAGGGGLEVNGALVVQQSVDLAGAVMRFSPCVVAHVLRRASSLRRVGGRSWIELF